MKISTKTGDFKMTDAISKRVFKDDPLIECLGTIDELQVSIMHAFNQINNPDIKSHLEFIVQQLFSFGENLIRDTKKINDQSVQDIEKRIEYYEKQLPEQKSFKLPGRTLESVLIHIARTVARRLERRVVTLGRTKELDPNIYAYINRLSDLLYIYARVVEEL